MLLDIFLQQHPLPRINLYYFLMDATTNCHQFDGLKQNNCLLIALEAKSKVKLTAGACSLWKHCVENTSCLVQFIVSFRIKLSLAGSHIILVADHLHIALFLFCLYPSPSCVYKYNYIHKSILIGISRKTTTLRSGPKKKKKKAKRKQEGEGVGLINGAANAFLRWATVQQLKHMSRWREHLCLTVPYLHWLLSAGTTDPIAQLWTSANMDIQHVDI